MRPKFSSFQGEQAVKDKYIARMKAHMAADELVQGKGYEKNNDKVKGCAVGCTLDEYSHFGYEKELGIPFTVAILEDNIFESLGWEDAKTFPLEFLEAVPIGVDLGMVYNKFEIWCLIDEKHGLINKAKTDEEKKICTDLAALHQKVVEGIETTEEDWENLTYMADRADMADMAYMAYMAFRADMAYMAYRAFRADMAYMVDIAYMAFRADMAYMADMADMVIPMRNKLIELLKNA